MSLKYSRFNHQQLIFQNNRRKCCGNSTRKLTAHSNFLNNALTRRLKRSQGQCNNSVTRHSQVVSMETLRVNVFCRPMECVRAKYLHIPSAVFVNLEVYDAHTIGQVYICLFRKLVEVLRV